MARSEAPDPDGLVADRVAALQEKLGDVSEPELVAQTLENREQDDVGGELEVVERRSRALVEPVAASSAREGLIAQPSTLLPFADGC
jgi:hypothetical protein